MSTSSPNDGVLLCDDMIFTSRITATARSLGLNVAVAGSLQALEKQATEIKPRGVILDLALAGSVIDQLVKDLEQWCGTRPHVIAYGSHVDTETLRAARAAGCDVVLPRSKFVEELPLKLSEWLSPKS
jgi:CheY-like chemotaxis protein